MKLSDYLREHGIDDDAFAAKSDGHFSAEAVRKWRFKARVPRPDQMRRIFDLTGGQVTPNDFVGVPDDDPEPARAPA